MAAVVRKIYADLDNGILVASSKSSQAANFPTAFHQDNIPLRIYPLELDPTRNATLGAFRSLDPTGWSLTAKLFTSAGTVLASQTSWTTYSGGSTADSYFSGSLDLNTAEMVTAFTNPAITSITDAIFEMEFTDGAGGKITVQKTGVTIKREYIVAGSPSALPLTSYFTKDEMLAMFVRFSGNPAGASITLKDETETYEVIYQCNTDGSNASNAVT